MKHIIFNGKVYEANAPIVAANNRGLLYGDGLFETIKLLNGVICNAGFHFDRLFEGMQLLDFKQEDYFTPDYLQEKMLSLVALNKHLPNARIRLMLFRKETQRADCQIAASENSSQLSKDRPDWIISTDSLAAVYCSLNSIGLKLGVCPNVKKATDAYAGIKSNNYQLYTNAARYASKQGWDDALILNAFDRIIESTNSNIFWLKNDVLYTPPLEEGPVAGTMRRRILQKVPHSGWTVKEQSIEVMDLINADAIFLSNALYGIRWVGQFLNNRYSPIKAEELYRILQ